MRKIVNARTFVSFVVTLSLISAGVSPSNASEYENQTLVVHGFAPNETNIPKQMLRKVSKFVNDNEEYSQVRCVGFSDNFGSRKINMSLAIQRAKLACAAIQRQNPGLVLLKPKGKISKNSGEKSRKVRIVLVAKGTFVLSGGSLVGPTPELLVGRNIQLPWATKPGYVFSGWYSRASGGNFVGFGGQEFTPIKRITLYAMWASRPSRNPSRPPEVVPPACNALDGKTPPDFYLAESREFPDLPSNQSLYHVIELARETYGSELAREDLSWMARELGFESIASDLIPWLNSCEAQFAPGTWSKRFSGSVSVYSYTDLTVKDIVSSIDIATSPSISPLIRIWNSERRGPGQSPAAFSADYLVQSDFASTLQLAGAQPVAFRWLGANRR